jgi:serine O-acetyltransferase
MASAEGLQKLIEPQAVLELAQVVKALAQAAPGPARLIAGGVTKGVELPSREAIVGIVDALRGVLFPGYFGESSVSADSTQFVIGSALDRVRRELKEQIQRGFCLDCQQPVCLPECNERAADVTLRFLSRLPAVQALLLKDAEAGYVGDPACVSADESIFCYPYMLAVTSQRLAHELYGLGVPLIPRMISEHAHSLTGIDIHPGAHVGESFFIDHGTGVVIGETCIIGKRVKLYQGVTLGALSFPLDEQGHPVKGIARHPIVQDDVTIYSGATILGRVTIGAGSVIGGNVWLTHSVPPDSRVYQAQARTASFSHGAGI